MFEITNIFGRISTSILDKPRNEVANLTKYVKWLQGLQGCVHFRLIFQSQNIDYFTPNEQYYA